MWLAELLVRRTLQKKSVLWLAMANSLCISGSFGLINILLVQTSEDTESVFSIADNKQDNDEQMMNTRLCSHCHHLIALSPPIVSFCSCRLSKLIFCKKYAARFRVISVTSNIVTQQVMIM